MKFYISLFTLFLTFNLSAQTQLLGLNDVSILLPLPKTTSEMAHFLSPTSEALPGKQNELLPASVFKFLPILTPLIDQEKMYQNNLKVVGIRFDPCFSEGFGPTVCQAQIRLVWQPIHFKTNSSNGSITPNTVDAAVHSFYNLTHDEWIQVIAAVKNISPADLKSPLQINPTLLSERFTGPYWTGLKKIVLQFAGKKNFVRATASTIRMDRVWGFQGIDRKPDGTWGQIEIPTLKSPTSPTAKVVNQAFFVEPESLFNLTEFKGGVTLMETSNKTWFRLLADSQKFKDTQSEDEIKEAIKIAFKLENPEQHNPGTIDCVSCHLAQTVRLWGTKHFPAWDMNALFPKDAYVNTQINMKNTSVNPSFTNRIRNFGYFNDEPIISQRLLNETAEIVKNPL